MGRDVSMLRSVGLAGFDDWTGRGLSSCSEAACACFAAGPPLAVALLASRFGGHQSSRPGGVVGDRPAPISVADHQHSNSKYDDLLRSLARSVVAPRSPIDAQTRRLRRSSISLP